MRYAVFTQFWLESSIGEQTNGPNIRRGVFDTKEQADVCAASWRESHHGSDDTSGGTWATIEEVA